MKYILAVFLVICCLPVHAIGNLTPVNIQGVYVRESRTDVILEVDHNNPTGCENTKTLIILLMNS